MPTMWQQPFLPTSFAAVTSKARGGSVWVGKGFAEEAWILLCEKIKMSKTPTNRGVNNQGNQYTSYSDGSYRYQNYTDSGGQTANNLYVDKSSNQPRSQALSSHGREMMLSSNMFVNPSAMSKSQGQRTFYENSYGERSYVSKRTGSSLTSERWTTDSLHIHVVLRGRASALRYPEHWSSDPLVTVRSRFGCRLEHSHAKDTSRERTWVILVIVAFTASVSTGVYRPFVCYHWSSVTVWFSQISKTEQ